MENCLWTKNTSHKWSHPKEDNRNKVDQNSVQGYLQLLIVMTGNKCRKIELNVVPMSMSHAKKNDN